MKFSVNKEMIDEAVKEVFPDVEEAYGMFAETSGFFMPKCYILVCTDEKIAMIYLGKVAMDFRDVQIYKFDEFDRWKVRKKLPGLVLDIVYANKGPRIRFVIRKRVGNFSDYQAQAIENLLDLESGNERICI